MAVEERRRSQPLHKATAVEKGYGVQECDTTTAPMKNYSWLPNNFYSFLQHDKTTAIFKKRKYDWAAMPFRVYGF